MSVEIKVDDLLTLSERSAVRKIENARHLARVISRDGVARLTPGEDVDQERVNLIIVEGVVTKAWIG